MTQISPLTQNPYSTFKMPSGMDTNKAVQTPQQPVNAIDNTKQEIAPQTPVSPKKSSGKVILGAVVAAAAIIGGVVYGVKSGKLNVESIKTKIPFYGKKYKERLAEEAARKAAEKAAPKAVQEVVQETNQKAAQKAGEEVTAETVQKVVEDAVKRNKRADANFFATVFGLGLIAKGFAKHMASKGAGDETDMVKLAYEKEQYMKEVELPLVLDESASYKENYSQKILSAIEKLQIPTQYMKAKYDSALALYPTLVKENSVETWPNTDVRKSQIVNNELTGTLTHYTFDKKGLVREKVVYVNDYPIQIESYRDDKLVAEARFAKKEGVKDPYMSHLFKHNPLTGKISGTLVYNENGEVTSYLARDTEGRLNKIFNIDPETKNIKSVCLSDDEGKKCTRKYFYDESGNIKEAYFAKTKDMPKHVYEFESGVATAVRFYNNDSSDVSVRVPFEV